LTPPFDSAGRDYPAKSALLLYLTSFITAGFVQRGLAATTGLDLPLRNLAGEVAAVVIVYVAILTLYNLLWALTRIPPLRTLLSVLSPTRYYRRYHEPGTDRRDLTGRKRKDPAAA